MNGEYHSDPMAKLTIAATIIAQMLMMYMVRLMVKVYMLKWYHRSINRCHQHVSTNSNNHRRLLSLSEFRMDFRFYVIMGFLLADGDHTHGTRNSSEETGFVSDIFSANVDS
jgi:hypothetical protein